MRAELLRDPKAEDVWEEAMDDSAASLDELERRELNLHREIASRLAGNDVETAKRLSGGLAEVQTQLKRRRITPQSQAPADTAEPLPSA